MEGTVLGQFRITHKLGEGGVAEVYAAEHELIGKQVAVKVLRPRLSADHDMVSCFFHEAQAAARIDHPGIVDVLDVGYTEQGGAYIVMEMLSGEPLSARLKRCGVLTLDMTMRLTRQLAGVMRAAHEHGIVHRDLKPDSIYIVPDPEMQGGERVKVVDFGLAKLVELTGSEITAVGTLLLGTPAYMASEQALDARGVDARTDLYAIGCILYRCLCGSPPFGVGGLDVLMAHVGRAPTPPRAIQPAIPPALEAIMLRLLEKPPERRFQSCADLIAALDRCGAASRRRARARSRPPHIRAER